MTEIRFAAEVRSAEDKLLARLPEGELMARASAGLAATCARLLRSSGGVYGAQVVLLVGSGNNGADALYAGAALARRGARTNAVSVGSGETHDGGTTALLAAGGRFVSAEAATGLLLAADLVVDGIVGLGNHGPLTPEAAVLANAAVAGGGLRVAVDLPSGVLADTGEIPDPAAVFRANVTVTFGARKPAHVLWPAAELAGVVEVIDIGLAGNWDEPASWRSVGPPEAARWFASSPSTSDKYSRGVVGVVAGSGAYPGAAVLATGAARLGGAGYVRYAGAAAEQVQARWPEVVAVPGRVQAWIVGPGLGTDSLAGEQFHSVLTAPEPIVIDADALTLLSGSSELLELLRSRTALTILTPHDRELDRLIGPLTLAPSHDRLTLVRRVAEELRCVVLAKGPTTLVAPPDGAAGYVVRSGSSALATAGTGDVLAGLLGSALAHAVAAGSLSAARATELAAAAAWVHGLAGRAASLGAGGQSELESGTGPVTASDVLAALPRALAGAGLPVG